MNKKFKIVSSLALAGMVAINVFSPKALATVVEDSIETSPVGVYRKLVEGKTVVPYVLVNQDDKVTFKEITNSSEFKNVTKFNGTAIPNEDTLISTGDTFEADGQEYTVVIYGDANSDGDVSAVDAMKVLKYSSHIEGEEFTLNDVEMEAADVENDGSVDAVDALRILKYSSRVETTLVEPIPAKETEEPVKPVESAYTVTVNDNNIINNQNEGKVNFKIKLTETSDKEKTVVIKILGADGKDVDLGTITIPAHTDYIESKDTPVSTIDLSKYDNGTLQFKLIEDKTTVSTFTAEKNDETPNATNVKTNRVSTKSATLSLEACGESDIAKVYYEYVPIVDGKETTAPAKIEKVVNVSDNKLNSATIATDLATDTAYDVYYVLENSYGSKSEVKKAVVTSDSTSVKQAEKIEKITVEDVTTFKWDEPENTSGKYIVTLYKDGKAVKTTYPAHETTSINFSSDMTEAGTYKVEVYVEGTADIKASESTSSEEVKVEKLAAVTDLKLENIENGVVLSWNNSNKEEDFANYSIELVSIDKDGKESKPVSVASPAKDKTEVDVTDLISENTIYKAKVVVNSNSDQKAKVSSGKVETAEFYIVGTPSVANSETTETTVTLSDIKEVKINGKTTTYQITVYDVNESGNPEEAKYTKKVTKSVEIKDGKIIVDGLESNKPYVFKLIATVDGESVESAYFPATNQAPVRTLPVLTNLTVVATDDEAKEAGKVHATSDSLMMVGGTTIDLSKYNGSLNLENSMKLINDLENGDEVSIDGTNVTLKLNANAAERDLSNVDLSKVTLDVESNNFHKTLKIGSVKELTLRGKEAIYNLDEVTAEKIVLTNGVEVTSSKAQEYTISAGAEVVINGNRIKASKETTIKVDGTKITVVVKSEANDLTFENKEPITINFEGTGDFASSQTGTITIKENATVTLTTSKANVNADLNVEVKNGTINLVKPWLTGNKNIVIEKDATNVVVKATAETKAPVSLKGISVDANDETLLKVDEVTEENLEEVKAYLNSFGLNGVGATLTVNKDDTTVTINVEKAKAEATIKNIK